MRQSDRQMERKKEEESDMEERDEHGHLLVHQTPGAMSHDMR